MSATHSGRVDWVDYAKGFCIIMVVMMHSTLGVEAAAGREGWLHTWVEFAKPFRMPDFFLISGLFLARVIDRDWRTYLDRKVVHFAYFYVLWVTIQIALKAPGIAAEAGSWSAVAQFYLTAFIEPFGTLWFIYLLPVFFVVTKLTRKLPPLAIFAVAAALEIAADPHRLDPDRRVRRPLRLLLRRLLARAAHLPVRRGDCWRGRSAPRSGSRCGPSSTGVLVFKGYADLPFISLALGLLGAGAVVTAATLLSQSDWCRPLRYCGANSIVIYLAFFLGMAASRVVLLKTGIVTDIGTISLLVTAAGVIGALVLFWLVRNTPFRFLFERPDWARLDRKRAPALQPAE